MVQTGSNWNRASFGWAVHIYWCLQNNTDWIRFQDFWYQSNIKILSIKKGSRELLTAMFGNSFLRFVDVIGGTLAPTGVTHWTLHKSFRFNPVDSKSTSDIWTKWWDPRIRLAGLTFFTWFNICFTSVFSPYICSLWIKDE